jgi:hypothetical protein
VGREPRAYTLWGRISAADTDRYVVTITAMTTDRIGPDELLGDTYTATTLEEAKAKRLEMIRAFCARLEAQGNQVSNVEILG